MRRCDACNLWVLLSDLEDGDYRYCSEACLETGPVYPRSRQLPAVDVRLKALKMVGGRCPRCQGPGPVELRSSYRVWSMIVLTHWSSRQQVACRRCGLIAQLRGLASSALLGWWGLPLGVLMTPVQIVRNLLAMLRVPDPQQPSPGLLRCASLELAQERIAAERLRG